MTEQESVIKLVKWGVAIVLLVIIILSSFTIVGPQERVIIVRLGSINRVLESGLHFKLPFIEGGKTIKINTQAVLYEREEPLSAASRDLQDVQIAVVINYHVDPMQVRELYLQYRSQDTYETQVVRPAVRDIVKATASQFTAEELVTKRAEFTEAVLTKLNERLNAKFSVVEQVNITNFEFSKSFTEAIEAKVTAVQNAEASKNKLEQVKYEAQQQIEKAKAEAESIRIQAQAITSQGGADYVQLQAIKQWKGDVPQYMMSGATVPFINLK